MGALRDRAKVAAVFTIFYFLLFYGLVGWKEQHLYLLILVLGMILSHQYSFYTLLALSGVLGWTMLYDAMTILPNHEVNNVQIKSLYDLEVSIFGVYDGAQKISLCEWFTPRYTPFLSFILGFSYLLWIPAPMAYGIYLLFKKRRSQIAFYISVYLLTNVIGVILYYLIPAAPPWYYLNHGSEVDFSVLGSAAGLAAFDQVVGVDIFQNFYVNNSNIFGAIPSLHAAYPLVCLFVARKNGQNLWVLFFALMSLGTWIAAVYTHHHYVIDVLCGIICAIAAYYFMRWISKTSWWKKVERWYNLQLRVIKTS